MPVFHFMLIHGSMLFKKNGGIPCPVNYSSFACAHSHALSWFVQAMIHIYAYKYMDIHTYILHVLSLALLHTIASIWLRSYTWNCVSYICVWCHSTVWFYRYKFMFFIINFKHLLLCVPHYFSFSVSSWSDKSKTP